MAAPKDIPNEQLLGRVLEESRNMAKRMEEMNLMLLTLVAELKPLMTTEHGGIATRVVMHDRDIAQILVWQASINNEKQRFFIGIIVTLIAALSALLKSFLK